MTVFATGRLLAAQPAPAQPITLGPATMALNGPWRFSVGDDPAWAAADFDDSGWESVDLTPAPGAHDGDVGLPGYVPGWSKRGHAGYTGYAWYRLRITVDSDAPLALAGPTDVDSTYQLYVDGRRLGGPGVFFGTTPTVYSVQPRVYRLPAASSGTHTYVIALRVWMDPLDAADDGGGIHVAPTIGRLDDINQLYQVQWLQTFKGYVVDAVEPIAFVSLAILALVLMACRRGEGYGWLAAALLCTAWLRSNQVFFFWTQLESLRVYDVMTAVLFVPLTFATWTLAWRDWWRLEDHRWVPMRHVILVLLLIHVAAALVGRPWFALEASHGLKTAADVLVQGVRLVYAVIYLWMIGLALAEHPKPSNLLSALAAILIGMGLFASELSAIGLQGIWFPWGTGVSRTQYAYAAFIVLLFALLLTRFLRYAKLWQR
ncbi:glycoside hydrolase family 2 [Dyella mobilis]|uniref:Glycoside hydrolase n=1 Tax=Dyella mobilis TaxID=1849582 RepID=A0ABS2KEQ9_9GAMM|nr:glycoside hydrolase family 2 [Dyella mobilis]MBM7129654.1 glycoside hydrolase [Dyella mobilis]